MPRRTRLRLLLAVLIALSILVPGTAAVAGPYEMCTEQLAEAKAANRAIKAHNARQRVFYLPRQRSAYNAYNAEAKRLNARQAAAKSRLTVCAEAMATLEDTESGSPALTQPRPEDLKEIRNAAKSIPANWRPPARPAAGKPWRVEKGTPVRGLYDVLRQLSPQEFRRVPLRGEIRPDAGSPDPAYPTASGYTIGTNVNGGSAVSPDHIVPLAEMIHMPGFVKLSPQNMYQVVNARVNLQWLSYKANRSKSSRSVAAMSGVDPEWQAAQVALENEVRKQLKDTIKKLLRSQK